MTFNMGKMYCPEMSVIHYQPTSRNIPEEPGSYLHRIESSKYRHSRIALYLICKYSSCDIVIYGQEAREVT
jgi:hypothetical protein